MNVSKKKFLAFVSLLPFLGTSWVIDNSSLSGIGSAATDLANGLSQTFFKVLPYIVPVVIVLMIISFVVHVIKRR